MREPVAKNRGNQNVSGGWFRLGSMLVAWLMISVLPLSAQTPSGSVSKAYQIKAVFLFNFSQFVSWPASSNPGAAAPFTIGVLGDNPFGNYLAETVRGEKVNGRDLVVQQYRRVEDATNCEILFISQSESRHFKDDLAALRGRNILTVGDTDGFAKNGGMVRFVTEQNKIHFRIDLEAAKAANLTISSQLLRLAEIINPGED
jgi:hypothetical protein